MAANGFHADAQIAVANGGLRCEAVGGEAATKGCFGRIADVRLAARAQPLLIFSRPQQCQPASPSSFRTCLRTLGWACR